MKDYSSVSLSKEFLQLIDEKIKDEVYTSRAEFIRVAVRNELRKLAKKEE